MLAATAAKNPFGRIGRLADIAATVAFVASEGVAYITGQEIVVSGGAGVGCLTEVSPIDGSIPSVPGAVGAGVWVARPSRCRLWPRPVWR
jgi:hypothetical protein